MARQCPSAREARHFNLCQGISGIFPQKACKGRGKMIRGAIIGDTAAVSFRNKISANGSDLRSLALITIRSRLTRWSADYADHPFLSLSLSFIWKRGMRANRDILHSKRAIMRAIESHNSTDSINRWSVYLSITNDNYPSSAGKFPSIISYGKVSLFPAKVIAEISRRVKLRKFQEKARHSLHSRN